MAFEEVLIFDNGSTDDTLEIAGKFQNVIVHKGNFKGFGHTHNQASSLASYDWILSIDSDEVLTPELVAEIKSLDLHSEKAYSIWRRNEFNGKFIKWCGWYPDFQVRLYHRKKTKFSDAEVHEAILTQNMEVIKLQHPMIHYSYDNVADFLSKMQSYSHLFAKQNCGKKHSSPLKLSRMPLLPFLKAIL